MTGIFSTLCLNPYIWVAWWTHWTTEQDGRLLQTKFSYSLKYSFRKSIENSLQFIPRDVQLTRRSGLMSVYRQNTSTLTTLVCSVGLTNLVHCLPKAGLVERPHCFRYIMSFRRLVIWSMFLVTTYYLFNLLLIYFHHRTQTWMLSM